jgi:hypothetical protein
MALILFAIARLVTGRSARPGPRRATRKRPAEPLGGAAGQGKGGVCKTQTLRRRVYSMWLLWFVDESPTAIANLGVKQMRTNEHPGCASRSSTTAAVEARARTPLGPRNEGARTCRLPGS